jgi:hypothetical protein
MRAVGAVCERTAGEDKYPKGQFRELSTDGIVTFGVEGERSARMSARLLLRSRTNLSDPTNPGLCRDRSSPRTTRKECEMRTAVGTRSNSSRHNHSLRQRVPLRRKNPPKEQQMTDTGQSAGKLLAFTIDANTAQIVKLERLDENGGRHELSDEEKTSLVHEGTEGRLEEVLERAFEAGIDCVLGECEADNSAESPEEAKLRHLLLTPLIEHSPAKRLLQREVLNRAILETLIEHSMKPAPQAPHGPGAGLQLAVSNQAVSN